MHGRVSSVACELTSITTHWTSTSTKYDSLGDYRNFSIRYCTVQSFELYVISLPAPLLMESLTGEQEHGDHRIDQELSKYILH